MKESITYKGEKIVRAYFPHERARYAVFKRKAALHGKWFIYRSDGVMIGSCEYKKGAIALCDELNALSRSY